MSRTGRTAKGRGKAGSVLSGIAVALGCVLFLGGFVWGAVVYQPYTVPTDSMTPTIGAGDRVLAQRIDGDQVKRGDVVVFREASWGDMPMVKRVVGIGGDLEHGAAMIHPRLGMAMRRAIKRGRVIIPGHAKVGPPGTAKSDLVLKFKDALGVPEGDYFEYMLTRFTEPSEVFGPIDIAELRAGRYLRRDRGKLPTARLVFLDEIFKASSAILNALLTVINERKFYQDGQPVPVKLRILFAATNELPENAELARPMPS